MWIVWLAVALCAGLIVGSVVVLRHDLVVAPWTWKLLASSGIPLCVGGLGFVVRFWDPQPGPYLANEIYPLGPYLNSWAVSFGFMWLAYGLAFFALSLQAPRTARTWFLLLSTWFLAWLPHGIIGAGFLAAGSNEPSLHLYRDWVSEWPGLLALASGALTLAAHFGLCIAGFAGTACVLWRNSKNGEGEKTSDEKA